MSAPKPAEDAQPVASLEAAITVLNHPPSPPSDEPAAATVWVIAKPVHTDPCKATET